MAYALYVAMVVGVLMAGHKLALYREKIGVMRAIAHIPAIASKIPGEDLAGHLQALTSIEHSRQTVFVMPYAVVCAAAVICAPFYFQTEIPIEAAMVLSAMVGWLFTYIYTKDFEPEWYVMSKRMLDQLLLVEMIEAHTRYENALRELAGELSELASADEGDQTLSESIQSNQQE